jgi:hypothetical protein
MFLKNNKDIEIISVKNTSKKRANVIRILLFVNGCFQPSVNGIQDYKEPRRRPVVFIISI